MIPFSISFLPSAAKDYKKLEKDIQKRVLAALDAIALQPAIGKPLQGPFKGLFSYRIGEYRMVYKIDFKGKEILLYRMGHRRKIYR